MIQVAISRHSDKEERATTAYSQYNLPDPEYRFQDIIADNQGIVDEVWSIATLILSYITGILKSF